MLAPLTLFVIVGTMSIKVAAVLLLCVPLIPVSIVAVQKFAKKLLAKYWGTYTELGDPFLENLQGLVTLKIYQADGRYAKKMDEEAEKFRKVTMRVLIMQLNSISVMDLVAYGGAALGIILSVLEYRAGAVTFAECFFYHYDLGGVFPSAASARLLLSYCDEWKCRCGQDFPVFGYVGATAWHCAENAGQ